MAPGALSGSSSGARRELCRRCSAQHLALLPRQQTRLLSLKVVAKRQLAVEEWDKKAQEIKEGKRQNLWDIFRQRGYVKDTAGTDKQIRELMRRKRIGAYVGIDPTAPSLHVGHLVPLMALFWMYVHGYRAFTIIGGATAKIGDPEGRLTDREAIGSSDLSMNITKSHYQLKHIWQSVDKMAQRHGYQKEWAWSRGLQNNSVWYNTTPFTEVMARLFSGIRLNTMLSRDTVKQRLKSGEGMPVSEFLYPLVQAWDWWHLYSSPLNFQMQIGGSDQYGNIVTGIEAINHIRATHPDPNYKSDTKELSRMPVGFTTPLLTDSSGAKFGKSAGNAVWLDPFMTSSYDLYGYFMRRPDADVERLLSLLTFLPTERINELMEEQKLDPSKRPAQHALAYEILALVHSEKAAKETKEQHLAMYKKPTQHEELQFPESGPATTDKAVYFKPEIELPESLIRGSSISRILYAAGLASSASDGNRIVKAQGAYVGGAPGQAAAHNKGMDIGDLQWTPVKNWFPEDTQRFLIDGNLLLLRRGKHFVRIVKMVSDEDWQLSGKSYPGEADKGKARQLLAALQAATPAGEPRPKMSTAWKLRNKLADLSEEREAEEEEVEEEGEEELASKEMEDEVLGDAELWNEPVGVEKPRDIVLGDDVPRTLEPQSREPEKQSPFNQRLVFKSSQSQKPTYRFESLARGEIKGRRNVTKASLEQLAIFKLAYQELREAGQHASTPSVKEKIKQVRRRVALARQEEAEIKAAQRQREKESESEW